jgi:hypothetical protein
MLLVRHVILDSNATQKAQHLRQGPQRPVLSDLRVATPAVGQAFTIVEDTTKGERAQASPMS